MKAEERGGGRHIGGCQGPFKKERGECAQMILFVATADKVDHKVGPAQMPEC